MAKWENPPKQRLFGWLWDALTPKPIPSAFSQPSSGEISPYAGMEGIQNASGDGMDSAAYAYEIEAEKIQAIQQYNSKGFTIYEFNPRLLDYVNNGCVLPPDEFFETIGQPNATMTSYQEYKSVILPITGNSLRIEFGPPKFRNSFGNTPFGGGDYPSGFASTTGIFDGPVFLNFGDVSGKSFKVKSGDQFNTYFNTVIVTFPGNYGKIRLISGFNSTYESDRNTIAAIHLAGSDVLANGGTVLKPTPFCVGNRYANDTAISIGSGATASLLTIGLSPFSLSNAESNVGWVDEINFSFSASAAGLVSFRMYYRTDNTGNVRTLWEETTVFIVGNNVFSRTFQTPKRFLAVSSKFGTTGLVVEITNSTGNTISGSFRLGGYALGPVAPSASLTLPAYFINVLDHVPWGVDAIGIAGN